MKHYFVLAVILGFIFTFGVFAQQLEIHHINVGQADATLIKSPTGITMLIDGGNTGNGTNIIRPYLTSLGITSLNFVVCSHYHADHLGGLDEVINGMGASNIGSVYDRGSDAPIPTTVAFNDYVTAANSTGRRYKVAIGQIIDLGGGVTMQCVATDGEVINYGVIPGATGSENDLSVGWKLNFNTFQYFTGGDLGGESTYYGDSETPLAPQVGNIDAMKINHHASQYSTNQTFVKQSSIDLQRQILIFIKQNSVPAEQSHPVKA
jgi:beta-lactamase superfamily II metal-dependent hydrolase